MPPVRRSSLLLVVAAASWGTATVISKRAVEEIQPLTLLPLELTVSVAVLTVALRATREHLVWTDEMRRLGLLGVLNPGVAYALSLAGLARITASTSVLLWALEPIVILVLAAGLLKQRVAPTMAACAATALAGVVLVVFQPGSRASTIGVVLTVAGVGACATYTVLSSRYLVEASTLSVVLIQQAAAFAFSLLLFVVTLGLGGAGSLAGVSPLAWISAIAAGVLYYSVAFWFYLAGLRGVPPGYAGMFLNLIPVFGIAASYLLLGERLTGRQWIGAALILIAVGTLAARQSRSTRQSLRLPTG
jgi:drug/metabolite transporter (DMT)-like permease